jgi:hypothetical protein
MKESGYQNLGVSNTRLVAPLVASQQVLLGLAFRLCIDNRPGNPDLK